MSSTESIFELSDEAKKDFRDILSYTLRAWGERQLVEYKNVLDDALKKIAQSPNKGKADFPPYRHVRAGRHHVFYKIERNSVSVSRILHGGMDFGQQIE